MPLLGTCNNAAAPAGTGCAVLLDLGGPPKMKKRKSSGHRLTTPAPITAPDMALGCNRNVKLFIDLCEEVGGNVARA